MQAKDDNINNVLNIEDDLPDNMENHITFDK